MPVQAVAAAVTKKYRATMRAIKLCLEGCDRRLNEIEALLVLPRHAGTPAHERKRGQSDQLEANQAAPRGVEAQREPLDELKGRHHRERIRRVEAREEGQPPCRE